MSKSPASVRNRDVPRISAEEARKNILRAMLVTNHSNLWPMSWIGRAAFPDRDLKAQGAALAVGKIARALQKEGLIYYISRPAAWGYYISSTGRELVETL